MNQSTKQRVVGIAVILIASAVILPAVFDGQGSYPLPLESRIPDPQPFPAPVRSLPERPVITADTDQIRREPSPAPQPATTEPVPADVTPADVVPVTADPVTTSPVPIVSSVAQSPTLDPQGLPQGWSVRLASFSSQANALSLLERLQSRGHRAYLREISSSQGPLIAVFVGPGVDRAEVQRLQQQLQDEFQLAGIVVRYEIEAL